MTSFARHRSPPGAAKGAAALASCRDAASIRRRHFKMLTPPGPTRGPMMIRTIAPRTSAMIPMITGTPAMIHRIVAAPLVVANAPTWSTSLRSRPSPRRRAAPRRDRGCRRLHHDWPVQTWTTITERGERPGLFMDPAPVAAVVDGETSDASILRAHPSPPSCRSPLARSTDQTSTQDSSVERAARLHVTPPCRNDVSLLPPCGRFRNRLPPIGRGNERRRKGPSTGRREPCRFGDGSSSRRSS